MENEMNNEMDNEMMSCEEVLTMLGEVANKHRDLDHMARRSLEMKKDSNSDKVAICMLDAAIALQIYAKIKKTGNEEQISEIKQFLKDMIIKLKDSMKD